jgi:hypothetical protein
MQITMTAELFKLDENVFRTVTESFMKQEMIKAVKEFLLASLPRIPARTGFLRGSFTEIANAFGAQGTGAGLGGTSSKREFYYPYRGASRILKTPRSGIKFASPVTQILRRSGDRIIFDLVNTIRYFEGNDFGSRTPGAPWGSTKEGLAAMVNYLERAADRFPRIDSILTQITVRSTGTTTSVSSKPPNVGAILASRQLRIEGF